MHAQAAVVLERPETFSPSIPTISFPKLDSFEVTADATHRAIWVTRRSDASASVTLSQLRETLAIDDALRQASDSCVKFKVLCSAQPGIFSLGGDLRLFRECIEEGRRDLLADYAALACRAIWNNVTALGARRVQSVALVAGEAQGGGFEAALSCNTLVAERGSSMGFPEPLFGLFPGMGAEILLATRVGADVARKLVSSSNRYKAEFLHEIGVVDYLVEAGTGIAHVKRILARSVSGSTESERMHAEARQARLEEIQLHAIETVAGQWLEQAMRLDSRNLRNMRYIIEMQGRRVA